MSVAKKIFNGFFWSLFLNVINALYGFFSVPLLLGFYGEKEYGLIGLAMSINVYLKLMDMGLSSGNVKYFSELIAKKDVSGLSKMLNSSIVFYSGIGFINFLVILALSFFSKDLFHLTDFQDIILKKLLYILMITALASWVINALEQFIRANELIGWHQRVTLIPKLIQILQLCVIYTFKFDIVIFFGIQSFSVIILLPILYLKIRKITGDTLSFNFKYNHDSFKSVLIYSLSIFSFSIFQFSANYLRPIILGIKIGLSSVAEYRIIEGFANLIMLLGASFVGVILPTASRIKAQGDTNKESQIAYDGTKYITIFLSLIVFGFILVSDELMDLYVGHQYSHLVIWLNLWVLTLLGNHNSALSSLVLSNDNLKPIVKMSGFSTIVSLGLAWYFINFWGIGGVIVGYVLYVVLQLSFYYIYYYPKVMGYDSYYIINKCVLKSVIPLFLLYIITKASFNYLDLPLKGITKVLIEDSVYGLLSIPVIYFVIFNLNDRLFLKKLLKF